MGNNSVIKMLVVIVERGKGDSVTEFLRARSVLFNFTLLGHGTASNQWSNLLGIGDSKKEVVFAVVASNRANEILNRLAKKFDFGRAGRGIAFTLDINSMSGKSALSYFIGKMEEN